MKKLSIFIFTLLLAIILTFGHTELASATGRSAVEGAEPSACSHEWLFVGYGESTHYYRKNATYHAKCVTEIYRCTKCRAIESYVIVGDFVPTTDKMHQIADKAYDGGHIEPNQHRWYKKCTVANCKHEQSTYFTCAGPPCPTVNSLVITN